MIDKSTLFTGQQWGGISSGFFEKSIMLMFGLSDNVYFSFGHNAKLLLWLISLLAGILFFIGLFKSLKDSRNTFIAAIFFLLLLLFYFLGSPVRMFSWYTLVSSVMFIFVAIKGIQDLIHLKMSIWLNLVILGLVIVISIFTVIVGLPGRKNNIMAEVEKDKKLINSLDQKAPGINSIMISDIGYIGYLKPWRIIDGSGLVSPQVLSRNKGEKMSYLSDIFRIEKPDVIYFKVNILDTNIVTENMRYYTFRNPDERKEFLDNYAKISDIEGYKQIFVRHNLMSKVDDLNLK
jgi:hypothetical protein